MKKKKKAFAMPAAFLDVVFLLLLYHIVILQVAKFAEATEQTLPPVNLSKMSEDIQAGNTEQKMTFVTIKSNGNKPTYFFGDREVSFQELQESITRQIPFEVCLRVDKSVPFEEVMRTWRMCREQNIENLSFAYDAD